MSLVLKLLIGAVAAAISSGMIYLLSKSIFKNKELAKMIAIMFFIIIFCAVAFKDVLISSGSSEQSVSEKAWEDFKDVF